jgi:hypothetical protein
MLLISPLSAEYVCWTCPTMNLNNLNVGSNEVKGFQYIKIQKDRAWSDCMDFQASLALYLRQRFTTFDRSSLRVI